MNAFDLNYSFIVAIIQNIKQVCLKYLKFFQLLKESNLCSTFALFLPKRVCVEFLRQNKKKKRLSEVKKYVLTVI